MNYNYINHLAKNILYSTPLPLAKVRFAKIVYFVFKELVRSGNEDHKQLGFIRMPLGPVPQGFMDLGSDTEITISHLDVGLFYNRVSYSIDKSVKVEKLSYFDFIVDKLKVLQQYSTSSLVELSHKDSSWIKYANGSEYFIEDTDLSNELLSMSHSEVLEQSIDNQLIQSKLVFGMAEDAVEDSTSLEYPKD